MDKTEIMERVEHLEQMAEMLWHDFQGTAFRTSVI